MLERIPEPQTEEEKIEEKINALFSSYRDVVARCPETGAELQRNSDQWILVIGEVYLRKSRQNVTEAQALDWGNRVIARTVKALQALAKRDVTRRARLLISHVVETALSEFQTERYMQEEGWSVEEAKQIEAEAWKIAKRLSQQADK